MPQFRNFLSLETQVIELSFQTLRFVLSARNMAILCLAKTVESQNVFKLKAVIGLTRQPQGKNWQRFACCSSSRCPGY